MQTCKAEYVAMLFMTRTRTKNANNNLILNKIWSYMFVYLWRGSPFYHNGVDSSIVNSENWKSLTWKLLNGVLPLLYLYEWFLIVFYDMVWTRKLPYMFSISAFNNCIIFKVTIKFVLFLQINWQTAGDNGWSTAPKEETKKSDRMFILSRIWNPWR